MEQNKVIVKYVLACFILKALYYSQASILSSFNYSHDLYIALTFLSSCHKSALILKRYKQKHMHIDTYLVFILNWGSLAYHIHLKIKLTLKTFQLPVYEKLLLGPNLWYRKSLSFCWVLSVWRHL